MHNDFTGTGCNAAYVERVDNMEKWDGPADHGEVMPS